MGAGVWVEVDMWAYGQMCIGKKGHLIMMVIISRPTISKAFLGFRLRGFPRPFPTLGISESGKERYVQSVKVGQAKDSGRNE